MGALSETARVAVDGLPQGSRRARPFTSSVSPGFWCSAGTVCAVAWRACTAGRCGPASSAGFRCFTCTSVRPMGRAGLRGMRRMRFCWSLRLTCSPFLMIRPSPFADLDLHLLLGAGEVVHRAPAAPIAHRGSAGWPVRRQRRGDGDSASCMPKRSPLAATAIRRRLPLKSGTGKATLASPLASSATGPLKRSPGAPSWQALGRLGRRVAPLELAFWPSISRWRRP